MENIYSSAFFFILTNNFAVAQQDTVKKDTTRLYENIESYSKRSKFTQFLHKLVFKPVAKKSIKKDIKKKVYKKLIQKPYSSFEGKIIRHIIVETLDPFGYSVADTIAVPGNFILRTGNTLHLKTLPVTIQNLLLFRQNKPFDSLLVKESERLVRSQRYVHDVSFFTKATSKKSDSVDIVIRVLDNWSIIPKVKITTSRVTIDLTDKNFLGFGHEYQNGFTYYPHSGGNAYNTRYSIPNIRNTYINSSVSYETDELRNYTRGISFDRPFFSSFAKWAAGANLTQHYQKNIYLTTDSLFVEQKLKINVQDYWAGNALRVYKGNTENKRTTNFISAIRFLRVRYLDKPDEIFDSLQNFSNENIYLGSVGISTRKYVQDKYIFKYGTTEDVPVGKLISLTAGLFEKNNSTHLYLGFRFSTGNYYPWGYLSLNFEYGTFIQESHAEKGTLTAGVNYFTGLFEIGKWKFRQFVKPQFMIGINRLPNESITLNDGNGLEGFNSPVLSGTNRLLLTLQTQSYTPWKLTGFRFGPYISCSFGMLSDRETGFKDSKLYSQLGFGILIKNDYLVINTFQVSITFYPVIPGNGQNIFKINSFKTADFGFRDFEIGKPATVLYQ